MGGLKGGGAMPFAEEAAGTGGAGTDWRWRRAGMAEYVVVPLAIAGTLIFEKENGEPARPNWRARNGFDESVRDALRLKSRSARDTAHAIGDVLMGVMIAAPVVDSFATIGWRDARWDALIQTSMVNLESFAFTSLVSSLMQNLIAREKPFVRNCLNGNCDDDEQLNRSMPSGHVAFAFTGAGLLCSHQKYQSLHDPATQRATCATGLGLAAADGIVRIMADRHYTTDVLAGTAIGLFSGFVLPRLLHYSWPEKSPDANPRSGSDDSLAERMTINAQLLSGGAALNWDLRF